MSTFWVITLVVIVELLNILLVFLGAYIVSKVYAGRLQSFSTIVQDAMALRDAQVRKLQAQFARAVIMDADMFDHALEDASDVIGDKDGRSEEDK